MAKNQVFIDVKAVPLTVTAGSKSGDPVAVGKIVGVCEIDADANNVATVNLRGGWALTVNAVDGSGNSAVAQGDIIYFTVGDTIKLSKKATGVPFGKAYGPLASGTSGVITVLLGV